MQKSSSPAAKRKAERKARTPKITAPLSELTKDMTDVPVRDMQAWVTRSVEERLEEAKKRKGYITRPMNSFMLYRSAYAERTKSWCAENNHQVVSSVSGESWPMEPPEVREFYNDLARIERVNHQNAHPEYKFSPAKPGLAGRKRKGTGDSDDESPDSDDDPDGDWGTAHKRARTRRPGRDAGYPARNIVTVAEGGFDDSYARSSWEASNLGRPLPHAIGHHTVYGDQYYQTQVQSHPYLMPGVEDVRFTAMDLPGGFGASSEGLIGLPGQSHYELQTLHSSSPTPVNMGHEPQVDPMLLGSYDPGQPGLSLDDGLALTQPVQYDTSYSTGTYGAEYPSHEYQTTSEWHPDSSGLAFEQSSDFEKCWDDGHYAQAANAAIATHNLSRRLSEESKAAAAAADRAMASALSAALVSPKVDGLGFG